MVIRPYLVATCAVLPLLAPEVWTGFRLAFSDVLLSVIAPTEQPLSVRSRGGIWALALTVAWFALAYRQRTFGLWEAALMLLGGGAALARVGNLWLDAVLLVVPLARRLSLANFPMAVQGAAAALSLVVAIGIVTLVKPPGAPLAAEQAALASTPTGNVLADWRWAARVQQRLGAKRPVFASV